MNCIGQKILRAKETIRVSGTCEAKKHPSAILSQRLPLIALRSILAARRRVVERIDHAAKI